MTIQIAYEEEEKRIRDNLAALEYQYDKGIEKGKIAIIKNMLLNDYSISDISDLTGLSISEIEKLRDSLS